MKSCPIIRYSVWVALAAVLLAACAMPATPGALPTGAAPDVQESAPAPQEGAPPGETRIPTPPVAVEADPPAGPALAPLAYLKDGDLWVSEPPEPGMAITRGAGLSGFAWAADGRTIYAFDGQALCSYDVGGSAGSGSAGSGSAGPCLPLGLDPSAPRPGRVALDPSGQRAVVWNTLDPGNEGAFGWLVIDLAGGQVQSIEDPVDWGLELTAEHEPGGITGQALFLADGSLVGALSHRLICAEQGCRYGLYRFDPLGPSINPVMAEASGAALSLSGDGKTLFNYNLPAAACQIGAATAMRIELTNGSGTPYSLPGEAITGAALWPDGSLAVIARSPACPSAEQDPWAIYCGLSQDLAVLPMQLWNLAANERNERNERRDLPPGVQPSFSKDGLQIAFRSCLTSQADGWHVDELAAPGVFIFDMQAGVTYRIDDGEQPAFQP